MRMKKIMALLLTAVMLLALVPNMAFAANPENIITEDHIRLYGWTYYTEINQWLDKIRTDGGIGWVGAGDTFVFQNIDFGDDPFYGAGAACAVLEADLETQGNSTVGGFNIYLDSQTPANLIATCPDGVDTGSWDLYLDNPVDAVRGITGVHTVILELTGKSQNFMYVEFRKASATQPTEKYSLSAPVAENNQLSCELSATKFLQDSEADDMATLAVAFYDANGVLDDIKLEYVDLTAVQFDGTKSYVTAKVPLTIDVTDKPADTTVRVFAWDNLFSQKLLTPMVSGTISSFAAAE